MEVQKSNKHCRVFMDNPLLKSGVILVDLPGKYNLGVISRANCRQVSRIRIVQEERWPKHTCTTAMLFSSLLTSAVCWTTSDLNRI